MIIDVVEEQELPQYNLGGREPSDEVKAALLGMRVPIKAIWCNDKHRWLLFRLKDKKLYYERMAPKGDLTPGIADWLGQFDNTEHGKYGDEERVKRWAHWFKHTYLDEDNKRREKRIEEGMYEVRHITKYLARLMGGNRQVVVPEPGAVAVHKTEDGRLVPVRAYKK